MHGLNGGWHERAHGPAPPYPSPQYRSGIYFHDDAQKEAALKKVDEYNAKLASGAFGSMSVPALGGITLPVGLALCCFQIKILGLRFDALWLTG